MGLNYLAQLPVKILEAKLIGTDKVLPVMVDGDYDGEYFAEYKWRVLPGGYVIMQYYEVNVDDETGIYVPRKGTQRIIYLHQLVLPPKKGFWTRHINGNKLDNRSANLRYMTPSESALTRQQGKHRTNKYGAGRSQYRGVQRLTRGYGNGKRWVSKNRWVVFCGRESLGTFGNETEAALAYDKRAKELWGDKATLNFPEVNHETNL